MYFASSGPLALLFATSEQLAAFTGQTAPADADRLLARASETIREATRLACYAVDTVGSPTDPVIAGALAAATCAQVEFWQASDEEEDVLGQTQGYSLGGTQLQYGAGDNRAAPLFLAPRAARLLRNAGLLGAAVWST